MFGGGIGLVIAASVVDIVGLKGLAGVGIGVRAMGVVVVGAVEAI